MDCSMPGLPVLHSLPGSLKLMCIESVMPSNYLIILSHCFSSCLQSFPASGSFPVSQLFASGGQSIEASASASVFPMNVQGWFHLGLIPLISSQSRGLSQEFFISLICGILKKEVNSIIKQKQSERENNAGHQGGVWRRRGGKRQG